uniref:BTB domain-containing protein n=1 Tax=Panagrolaimus sp. ES5 TaxID=591445 RepID=A0AC34F3L6_9BILA
MFSEKWTSKDEPIELNQYSYENYKELLTFIYSGTCELNDNNIISIVDMAEMYEIIDLKEYCDDNFPSQNFDNTNVFNWIEFANKYSLTKLNEDLEEFVKPQFCELLESDQFFLSNKFVIEGFVKYAGDLGQAENEQCFNKRV